MFVWIPGDHAKALDKIFEKNELDVLRYNLDEGTCSFSDRKMAVYYLIGERYKQIKHDEKAAKEAAEAAKIKAVIRDSGAEIKPIVDERLVEKGLLRDRLNGALPGHYLDYRYVPTPPPARPARKAKKAGAAKKARRGKR